MAIGPIRSHYRKPERQVCAHPEAGFEYCRGRLLRTLFHRINIALNTRIHI